MTRSPLFGLRKVRVLMRVSDKTDRLFPTDWISDHHRDLSSARAIRILYFLVYRAGFGRLDAVYRVKGTFNFEAGRKTGPRSFDLRVPFLWPWLVGFIDSSFAWASPSVRPFSLRPNQ